MIFRGIVENNIEDVEFSKQRGRVQVRVFGIHSTDSTIVPTEALPWAEVQSCTSFGLIGGVGISSVLRIDTWVYVQFLGGDIDLPIVTGVVIGECDLHENVAKSVEKQIIKTASGHIIELSDVDGAESIKIEHKAGATIDMDKDNNVKISATNVTVEATSDLLLKGTTISGQRGSGDSKLIAMIGDAVVAGETGTITAIVP